MGKKNPQGVLRVSQSGTNQGSIVRFWAEVLDTKLCRDARQRQTQCEFGRYQLEFGRFWLVTGHFNVETLKYFKVLLNFIKAF